MKIIERGRKGPASNEHVVMHIGKKPEPETAAPPPAKVSAMPIRVLPAMTKVASTLLGGKK